MNDELREEQAPRDWDLLCEVCAQPITDEMEICPECKNPIVLPEKVLEPVMPTEQQSKKTIRRKTIAYMIDSFSFNFVKLVLLASIPFIYWLLNLANEDWRQQSEIWDWILGYAIMVVIAVLVLLRISRKVYRDYEKNINAETES